MERRLSLREFLEHPKTHELPEEVVSAVKRFLTAQAVACPEKPAGLVIYEDGQGFKFEFDHEFEAFMVENGFLPNLYPQTKEFIELCSAYSNLSTEAKEALNAILNAEDGPADQALLRQVWDGFLAYLSNSPLAHSNTELRSEVEALRKLTEED